MAITDFTLSAYCELLENIGRGGYTFANYHNYADVQNPCILRHDVDFSLEKAENFARLEHQFNIKSTYFVLLSTDFYNIHSQKSRQLISEIGRYGHEIGLHFDEKTYDVSSTEHLVNLVEQEANILSKIVGKKASVVSMHRPSKEFLSADIFIPNVVNSYSKIFMNDFKYFSDSRMFWREDAQSAIDNKQYEKLHILTHPFWYSEENETTSHKLEKFIKNACKERYEVANDNFRDIDEFVSKEVFV